MPSDHRTPEQQRDDDFEAIRRGLNETIAHAKGKPEADGVRIHVPDESPTKTCGPIETDLKGT